MQLNLTVWSAGRVLMGVLALGLGAPGWMSANVGAAVHVPSGRIYIETGTEPSGTLRVQAIQACGQKELGGDRNRVGECEPIRNFSAGPCDAKYGKGNQHVTVGGYSRQPKPGTQIPAGVKVPPAHYNGFMYCGKSQQQADQGFQKHCGGADCSIWQHYVDTNNQ